jgi:hypothetical protein
VTGAAALILIATVAIGGSAAGDTLRSLGPTVAFLAALLLIAEGCRRAACLPRSAGCWPGAAGAASGAYWPGSSSPPRR